MDRQRRHESLPVSAEMAASSGGGGGVQQWSDSDSPSMNLGVMGASAFPHGGTSSSGGGSAAASRRTRRNSARHGAVGADSDDAQSTDHAHQHSGFSHTPGGGGSADYGADAAAAAAARVAAAHFHQHDSFMRSGGGGGGDAGDAADLAAAVSAQLSLGPPTRGQLLPASAGGGGGAASPPQFVAALGSTAAMLDGSSGAAAAALSSSSSAMTYSPELSLAGRGPAHGGSGWLGGGGFGSEGPSSKEAAGDSLGGSRGQPACAIKLLVSNNMAGGLIGKAGATIQSLQAQTGALVNVSSSACLPGILDRVVLISGDAAPVKMAVALVLHTVHDHARDRDATEPAPLAIAAALNEQEVTQRLLIPAAAGGLVIGWRGSGVQALSSASGARVSLSHKRNPASAERVMTIHGALGACRLCIDMLLDVLRREPAMSRYLNLSVDPPQLQQGDAPAAGAPSSAAQQQQQQSQELADVATWVGRGAEGEHTISPDSAAGPSHGSAQLGTAQGTHRPPLSTPPLPVLLPQQRSTLDQQQRSAMDQQQRSSIKQQQQMQEPQALLSFELHQQEKPLPQHHHQHQQHFAFEQQQQHMLAAPKALPPQQQQQQHAMLLHSPPQHPSHHHLHQHMYTTVASAAPLTMHQSPTLHHHVPPQHVLELPVQQAAAHPQHLMSAAAAAPLLQHPSLLAGHHVLDRQQAAAAAALHLQQQQQQAAALQQHVAAQQQQQQQHLVTPAAPVGYYPGGGMMVGMPVLAPVVPQMAMPMVQHPDVSAVATTIMVSIPDALIGVILGRGGVTVNELQMITGARISVSRRGNALPGTTDRVVTITGSAAAAHAAQYMMMHRVQEACAQRMMQAAAEQAATYVQREPG